MNLNTYFASCPKGLESLLFNELQQMGASSIKETVTGVHFKGNLQLAYHCCMWSRLSSRILLKLHEFNCHSKEELYQGIQEIDWQDHITKENQIRIDFTGKTADINDQRFGSYVVKDAIVDQLLSKKGWRPNVDVKNPNFRLQVHVRHNIAMLYLDLSGHSLHQRGYRLQAGVAPLKENLAVAVLIRSGWQEKLKQQTPLLDPMCGSGTLLIEGAMMMTDTAPGLLRLHFGFNQWQGHIPKLWMNTLAEAKERRQQGFKKKHSMIIGFEGSANMISRAKENITRAGFSNLITVSQQELHHMRLPNELNKGLIVCNPPYGKRLGEKDSISYLYQNLSSQLKSKFAGWEAGLLIGDNELNHNFGMGYKKKFSLYNGSLPCKLFLYDIRDQLQTESTKKSDDSLTNNQSNSNHKQEEIDALPSNAQMLVNRLKKNQRILSKWVKKNSIQCYRIYDADLPEFSLAIDVYKDWLHVQEYAPPASIPEETAQQRLKQALKAIPIALNIPKNQVILKQRKKQKGDSQYQRLAKTNKMLSIQEHGAKLLLNLYDYLDSGLFLDHRLLRKRIQNEANKKRFLNLFCYTATATVQAALGGASTSTSVDLSNTYINWARKNFALNGLSEARHKLIKSDCISWLIQDDRFYDIILIDPPTFSNSKNTKEVFDVQKDHSRLIHLAMKRLSKNGHIYFSNNFRRFQLDEKLSKQFSIINITPQTIDKDFQKKSHVHQCWLITHLQ